MFYLGVLRVSGKSVDQIVFLKKHFRVISRGDLQWKDGTTLSKKEKQYC